MPMTHGAGSAGSGGTMSSGALPEGWILRVSRSKGKVFYYNTRTRVTQWTRPEAEAMADVDDEEAASSGSSMVVGEQDPTTHGYASSNVVRAAKRKRDVNASARVGDYTLAHAVHGANGESSVSERRASIVRCMRVGASSHSDKPFLPWEHQVDAVEQLTTALQAETDASARTSRYLLQHSTGSGKTVTIAALTHELLQLVDASGRRFHTVVLLIDRIKLDEQVGDSVEMFLRRNGIGAVYRATSIDHLVHLLSRTASSTNGREDRTGDGDELGSLQRVIITTIQKIGLLARKPVLLTRLLHGDTADSTGNAAAFARMAIITDEAHRSHTKVTRQTIEQVIEAGEEGSGGVTFVGFTATPNHESLELFGTEASDGCLRPFHCYSMSQAVADGRIVDVLQDYRTVRCNLETSIPTEVLDELYEQRLVRLVLDAASDDIAVLKAKVLYMLQDFEEVKALWTRAKCMIVTRSRRDVVRYYHLAMHYIRNKRRSWKVCGVFSGVVTMDHGEGEERHEISVTEQTLNEKNVTLAISDIVIVCDKLDTGYSDPLLSCMYIDRYLRSSARAVQLLSRLNRRHEDKRTVRIVDFANHVAQMRCHFAAFWSQAQMPSAATALYVPSVLREFLTGTSIACDVLCPWMWPKRGTRDHIQAALKRAVISMEQDAIQQIMEALKQADDAWNLLLDHGIGGHVASVNLLSQEHVELLRRELALHFAKTTRPNLLQGQLVQSVTANMVTRVSRYEVSFRGSVHPLSLIKRSEGRNPIQLDPPHQITVSVANLYGDLEKFETLMQLFVASYPESLTIMKDAELPAIPHRMHAHIQAINSLLAQRPSSKLPPVANI